MKKILFLINNLGRGGAERAFVNQINYLHQRGVPVYLGLLFSSPASNLFDDLTLPLEQIIQIGDRGDSPFKLWWRTSKLIRHHKINIVYSTLELPNIMARTVKILHPRLRVVTRDGSAVTNARGQTDIKSFKSKILDIGLNLLADAIIAVSAEIAQILKSYQPFYRHKITVWENGVIINEAVAKVEERAKAKITRVEFRVLTAASMNYYERAFEYLIDALPLLPPELLQRTKLIFAGDGTLRSIYEAQVKKLGLSNQVQFLGRLDTLALTEEYWRANVFVLCSTAEGSPNVILEAMSYGLPVVTTPVGSAVNMVKDGETGFFIPFKNSQAIAEKLGWLAEHPNERYQMGLHSYDRAVQYYSFDQKMKELEEILGL